MVILMNEKQIEKTLVEYDETFGPLLVTVWAADKEGRTVIANKCREALDRGKPLTEKELLALEPKFEAGLLH